MFASRRSGTGASRPRCAAAFEPVGLGARWVEAGGTEGVVEGDSQGIGRVLPLRPRQPRWAARPSASSATMPARSAAAALWSRQASRKPRPSKQSRPSKRLSLPGRRRGRPGSLGRGRGDSRWQMADAGCQETEDKGQMPDAKGQRAKSRARKRADDRRCWKNGKKPAKRPPLRSAFSIGIGSPDKSYADGSRINESRCRVWGGADFSRTVTI